ncbi:CHAT domain-containing protein [Suillus lakei]|nr:CHAT domain-containing protein [Suillus lakei]
MPRMAKLVYLEAVLGLLLVCGVHMSSFVPGHFNDYPPPLGEVPSHPERHQDLGQTNLVIIEVLQVVIYTMLATVYFVITLLFRFATDSVPDPPDDTLPALGKEPSHLEQHPQDPEETHLSGVQQVVITSIRATDLTLGLRRIPAGFHVAVKADGAEYQTSNKPVDVDQVIVEWNERILLPCEPSSIVRISVYASFELGPMLCHGEVLRTFEISVGELLDRSKNSHFIMFQPEQEEVISPCTSLFMTIEQEQRLSDENDATVLCPLSLYWRRTMDIVFLHNTAGGSKLHLAIALLSRFVNQGFQTDGDLAGELLREVLSVCHANSHIYRAALAIERFALHPAGSIHANDLEQERPVASMPQLSPDQLAYLAEQCLRRDDPHALDEVISLHYDALGYYNTTHTCRGQLLGNLSTVLLTRFERRGSSQDLDEAMTLIRETLALYPRRSMSLNTLANGLIARFEQRGNYQDLDEAIVLHREALALRPVGHTDRSMSLINLAAALSTRFDHRGNDQHLDEAITHDSEALALLPVGHPHRSASLNNLAIRLSTRFNHRGNDEDLDQAIALYREVLALLSVGHPDRPGSLYNLAIMLSTHFDYRGNDQYLDESIALHREAVALFPVGHRDQAASLDTLGNRLSTRFDSRRNDTDLDQAIALHREALALLPVGHPHQSESLHNLANRLSTRFDHRGNDEDLDQAIALYRESLALCPVGHRDRSTALNSLSNQLFICCNHRGNDEDLDRTIALQREALALRPIGHPDRSSSLNNLATQLATRFEHQGNGEDLNKSREHLCCALTLLTQHDPHQSMVHKSLAAVYLLFHRSRLDGTGLGEDTDNLNDVMYHLKIAANVVSAGLLPRLQASLRWIHHAHQYSHDIELEAYATSIQLLDAFMSATASVSSRHNAIKDFPRTLAVDAASCALRGGDVHRAVELLEQGRTLIWTQMARFRMPLDNLPEALTKTFRDISFLLDKLPANQLEGTPRVDVEAEAARYRHAARDGPVVMLIASKLSCDAIIIPHKQPPTSIQLPINFEKLLTLATFQEVIEKEAGPKGSQTGLIKALRELWDKVVHPVVKNLGGFARRGSRVWWCLTSAFNFLPLHAAGEYRENGQSLSQLYASSYTPSLVALMRARRSHDRSPSVLFAAIGQNHPDGASFTLDGVEPELELVRSLLPPSPSVSFTKITSVDATKSRALHALRDNTWLHFACHGTQNYEEPFKSAFLMCHRPLSLLDITQTDLSRHQFAFLSACETAVGDFHTPDEVVHLAAGLQFAGVKSVIGTLWKVNDATVQRLVEAFYKNLCGDGTMNSKRAARALHQAVQSLACDKSIPLDQRIVFIHIVFLRQSDDSTVASSRGYVQLVGKWINFDNSDFGIVCLSDMYTYSRLPFISHSVASEPKATAPNVNWFFVPIWYNTSWLQDIMVMDRLVMSSELRDLQLMSIKSI